MNCYFYHTIVISGGGAPNESIRRADITLDELFPEPQGVAYNNINNKQN